MFDVSEGLLNFDYFEDTLDLLLYLDVGLSNLFLDALEEHLLDIIRLFADPLAHGAAVNLEHA